MFPFKYADKCGNFIVEHVFFSVHSPFPSDLRIWSMWAKKGTEVAPMRGQFHLSFFTGASLDGSRDCAMFPFFQQRCAEQYC